MKVKKLTGLALATAAAGMFAMTVALPAAAQTGDKVKCEGGNSCRGKSDCKGAKSSCKGKNDCKGQGFTTTATKEACDKAKEDAAKK